MLDAKIERSDWLIKGIGEREREKDTLVAGPVQQECPSLLYEKKGVRISLSAIFSLDLTLCSVDRR